MNFLDVAIKAAKAGGKVTEQYFEKTYKSSLKAKNEIVTEVDHFSEEAIISVIKKHFPEHGIWSEERPEEKGNEYRWVIDPIDGTRIFSHDLPWYGIVVALEKGGKPIVGVHYFPKLKRLYTAEKGKGAFKNGKKISVSSTTPAQKKFILITTEFMATPSLLPHREDVKKRLLEPKDFGSAALHLSLVAEGKADAALTWGTKPCDIAAGILMIREAGGKMTDFEGNPATSKHKRIIASNGKIHAYLRQ